jgi:RND family efflux transporter MFP subunit
MTGGSELHIRSMSENGAPVQKDEVVVQLDTTDQEFALREAESDVAEADQHVLQASAQLQADAEEDRYALDKAKTDVELAELDARKNPILPAITAKQNDLGVAVARDKLAQLEQDLANKKATDEAGIAMQQAAKGKAEAKALTAKQNIESMTLKAERSGYVSLKQNTGTNFFFTGMELPVFQVGDQVRPGMAIAEIPDLNHWEVAANIGELDRGHLKTGDQVAISVVALPQRSFHGHVTDIGSTSGMPWDRRFECKATLDNPSPELRPGMSTRVEITTETMKNALWVPAQALFESDGKVFVYLRSGATFSRKDVTLVRRNETRVVLTGLQKGQEVALANPTDLAPKKNKAGSNPLEAIQK